MSSAQTMSQQLAYRRKTTDNEPSMVLPLHAIGDDGTGNINNIKSTTSKTIMTVTSKIFLAALILSIATLVVTVTNGVYLYDNDVSLSPSSSSITSTTTTSYHWDPNIKVYFLSALGGGTGQTAVGHSTKQQLQLTIDDMKKNHNKNSPSVSTRAAQENEDSLKSSNTKIPREVPANLVESVKPKAQYQQKKKLSPMRWRTFGYQELYTFFECDKNDDTASSSKQQRTNDQWIELQQYYHTFTQSNKKFGRTYPFYNILTTSAISVAESKDEQQQDRSTLQKYYVANENIPKNTHIILASNNTVVFSSGRIFRKFVWSVHHEHNSLGNKMACHLLRTAHVYNTNLNDENSISLKETKGFTNVEQENGHVIVADLDNVSLQQVSFASEDTNTAKYSREDASSNDGNIVCKSEQQQQSHKRCRVYEATRDIHKGAALQITRNSKSDDTDITRRDDGDIWRLVGL